MTKRLLHQSPWVIIGHDRWTQNESVLVEDGIIKEIGEPEALVSDHPDAELVDCSDLLLMPGFANCHNHVYEILCRGLGKQADTEGWLFETIYPMNRKLTDEDYYHGALLGAADCFRTGTTSLVSQLTNFARFHADAEARGFTESGIRARVARASSTASTIDPEENASPDEELEATEAFIERWSEGDKVKGAVGPAGLFSCDPDTHVRLKALARERGTKYFTHLNETRAQLALALANGYPGQIDWAYRLGILDSDSVIAHAVWSTMGEFRILADTGAMVVHNPSSNMVMSSGVPAIPAMLDHGVHVSVATDGPASNDSQDMFGEMKAAVLLQKLATLDPTILDAGTAFRMATEAGARVFDLEGSLGRLEKGWVADVVGVRVGGNPCFQPIFDPVAACVYYGSGRDVAFTMIEGEFVYRDGEYPTIDIEDVLGFVQNETVPRVREAVGL
ncbi:MAG: amidohydrolase [Acidimicrobiia bacterium]